MPLSEETFVIPTEVGIQISQAVIDSHLRGNNANLMGVTIRVPVSTVVHFNT